MRFFSILSLCLLVLFLNIQCSRVQEVQAPGKKTGEEAKNHDTRYKNELEEIKKNLKGDIRIKLKKDSKGGYSWEITGKDAGEVLKANDTLRKKLSD